MILKTQCHGKKVEILLKTTCMCNFVMNECCSCRNDSPCGFRKIKGKLETVLNEMTQSENDEQ